MSEFPKSQAIELGALPPEKLRLELRPELNQRFEEHKAGLNGLRQDTARVNARVLGYGRIIGLDADANDDMKPRLGVGHTVQLPAGYEALIEGLPFLAGDPDEESSFVVLPDVPVGVSYGVLYYAEGETEPTITWLTQAEYNEQKAQLKIAGIPCIGKVTADAGEVTAIDATFEDLVWSQALIQARIKALMVPGDGEEGGAGGGPGYATTLPVTPEDATDTYSYFSGLIADLAARVDSGGNGEPIPQPIDVLADNLSCVLAGVAEVNFHAVERPQISIVGKEFGHGQHDTPDFTPDTNDPLELPFDPDTGLFGP